MADSMNENVLMGFYLGLDEDVLPPDTCKHLCNLPRLGLQYIKNDLEEAVADEAETDEIKYSYFVAVTGEYFTFVIKDNAENHGNTINTTSSSEGVFHNPDVHNEQETQVVPSEETLKECAQVSPQACDEDYDV